MLNKETILHDLHQYNLKHEKDGFSFFSLFGSYAREENDLFSDIDITYKIDHTKFYKDDAFAKLKKLDEIKQELQNLFHRKIDLIPANTTNKLMQNSLNKEQILI